MSRTQVKEQVAFQEVRSNAVSLFILQQRGNRADSMALLSKNGLRPLTYQEAFSRSSELIQQLKGEWFYLYGQGIQEKSGIYTFNEKTGDLVQAIGNESIDKKVHVWSGNQSLSLFVRSDNGARDGGERFLLFGFDSPDIVAPVVVGVKQVQAGSVSATQNEALVSLLRVDEGQSIVLTYPNGMKTETKVPSGTTVHIE